MPIQLRRVCRYDQPLITLRIIRLLNGCKTNILFRVSTKKTSILSDQNKVHMVTMKEQSDASSVLPARESHSMGGKSFQHSDAAVRDDDSLQVDETGTNYPPLWKTMVIISGLFMGVFLVALDQTIIGTAIPKITDEFKTIQVSDTQPGAPLFNPATLCERLSDRFFFFLRTWAGMAVPTS